MDIKIDDITKYEGKLYKCIKSPFDGVDCVNCAFYKKNCNAIRNAIGQCRKEDRWDNTSVIFKEIKENTFIEPFNIDKAKLGEPVCTKEGRNVRILCFDIISELPIVAAISNITSNGKLEEIVERYNIDGKISKTVDSPSDLIMKPREIKEGFSFMAKDANIILDLETAKKLCPNNHKVVKIQLI